MGVQNGVGSSCTATLDNFRKNSPNGLRATSGNAGDATGASTALADLVGVIPACFKRRNCLSSRIRCSDPDEAAFDSGVVSVRG